MNIETTTPADITTREHVKAFLYAVVITERLGYGFHPDTWFEDYVNIGTDERVYNICQADKRKDLLSKCFDVVGEDTLYEILEEVNPISGIFGPPTE